MSRYDAIAEGYDRHFTRPVDQWEDCRLAALLSPLVDGRDVLDLGCGTGWLADHCRPAWYTGVDCSAPMLAELMRKHPDATTVKATIGEPGWHKWLGRAPWDVVTATWSLQYLGDLAALLAAAFGLVQPDGVIALHGYLPRYRRRSHEITGEARPVIWPREVYAASRAAGLPRPVLAGTGSLPDGLARSRVAWEVAAALVPSRWHLAGLWTWRLG